MRQILPIAACWLMSAAATAQSKTIIGSGTIISKSIALKDFDKLDLNNPAGNGAIRNAGI